MRTTAGALVIVAACGPSPETVAADWSAKSAAHYRDKCPPRSPDGKFDRGCAAVAMGIPNVQECKRQLGPTGAARVEVTFAPDGHVTEAGLVEPGAFAGTDIAECVVAKFRTVQVPAFDGPPVHVKKSLMIE